MSCPTPPPTPTRTPSPTSSTILTSPFGAGNQATCEKPGQVPIIMRNQNGEAANCFDREQLPACGQGQVPSARYPCKPYSTDATTLTSSQKELTQKEEAQSESSLFDVWHSHLNCRPGGCNTTSVNQINNQLSADSAYFPSMAISGNRMFVSFLYGHGDDADLVIVECDKQGRNCNDPISVTDPNRSNPLDAANSSNR